MTATTARPRSLSRRTGPLDRSLARAVGVGLGALALLGPATIAAAHVTVQPGEAQQGGYAAVAFRVPNERDDAATTRLQVTLPEDAPIASVRVKPHPGWTYRVQRRTLEEPIDSHGREITEVVSSVTWTASADAKIKPGEYDDFWLSLGPLPEAERLVFKAVQTYDSGEEVGWVEEAAEGVEAEHPAPVLTLVAAEGEESADGAGSGDGSADVNQVLVGAALGGTLLALVLAGLALRRRR